MCRAISYLNLLFVLFSIFPQQLSHEVRVVNIAVPVRVYNGDKFIDSLKLEDFELFEDGRPPQGQAGIHLQSPPGYPRRQRDVQLDHPGYDREPGSPPW